MTVRTMPWPASDVPAPDELERLTQLPKSGPSPARTIERLAETGTTPLLQRLCGHLDPETTPAAGPWGRPPRVRRRARVVVTNETAVEREARWVRN